MKGNNFLIWNNISAGFFMFFYIFFISCNGNYSPKPRGYFRIDLPEKEYQQFSSTTCPFEFEYPVYAKIVYDTVYFDTLPEHPCWLNIEFPDLKGKIHITYKEILNKEMFYKLLEDSHKLTSKHIIKAESINESIISTSNHVFGLMYEIGGNAASSVQYYLTDSTNHYIRGSLYFHATPNVDSLLPVIEFVKKDIMHMIKTFKWDKNPNVHAETTDT